MSLVVLAIRKGGERVRIGGRTGSLKKESREIGGEVPSLVKMKERNKRKIRERKHMGFLPPFDIRRGNSGEGDGKLHLREG